MAILTFDEIKGIIESGTPKWIGSAREYTKILQMNINGIGVDKYLSQINGYENDRQYVLRQKFATSNKFVFENLLRPVDKVFSASGGATIIKTKTDTSQKIIKDRIEDVSNGYTLRNFIKNLQSNKYYSDPSGLVFFEWKDDKTYPTFKSINVIQNYELDGRTPEWVLFEPEKRFNPDGSEIAGEFYRFIDGAYDYTIHVIDERYTIIEDETYINPWGKVPALTNSDTLNSKLTYHISPTDSVIELANHYLVTTSVKNIYEFLHGYPVFWAYVQPCKLCDGTGLYKAEACPSCGGDGHTFSKDVSDIIKLKPPTSNEEPKIAPDVAGYVQPDLETLDKQTDILDWLWGLMHFSMWGTAIQDRADNETATAAFIDVQPVNDRLNRFADAYEQTETLMIDILGSFYLKDNYEGASVNYGRRFLVEPPDAIWNKYMKARTDGAPKVSLDYLLIQFYQSEYKDDLINLAVARKGVSIEPFVHKTDEQINLLPVIDIDKMRKFYFNEWWSSLSENDILLKDKDKLVADFDKFMQSKVIIKNQDNGTDLQ